MKDKNINNNGNKKALECPYAFCAKDAPTKFAHLGWRAGYTLITWIVLGYGVSIGSGFFISLILFAVPLLMDYLRFEPDSRRRKLLKKVEVIFMGVWTIFGVIGLFGIIFIEKISNKWYIEVSNENLALQGYRFALTNIWYIMGVCVALTIIDWIVYENCVEKEFLNKNDVSTAPNDTVANLSLSSYNKKRRGL